MIQTRKKNLTILLILMTIFALMIMCTQTAAVTISKVTGLSAKVTGTKVKLNWSKVSGAAGYEVHVNIPELGYVYVGSITNNSATVSGFTEGATYKAKIRAYKYVNGQKTYGDYSSEVTFKTETTTVAAPAKVTGLSAKVTGTVVELNWNKVSGAEGYEINMVIPGYGTTTMTTTSTSKSVSGLTTYGYSYTTKVRAYKYVNGKKVYGDYSNSVEVYRK